MTHSSVITATLQQIFRKRNTNGPYLQEEVIHDQAIPDILRFTNAYQNERVSGQAVLAPLSICQYGIEISSIVDPQISLISSSLQGPSSFDDVVVRATVEDHLALDNVILYCRIGDGNWITLAMSGEGETYTVVIPAQSSDAEILFYIEACDVLGKSSVSGISSYTSWPASFYIIIALSGFGFIMLLVLLMA